jgi:predicted ATPase
MESFTEFDILASNCLKRLKIIANNYGEDQTRIVKCFLAILFFKEYILHNGRFAHLNDEEKLVEFLEHPEPSQYLSQSINMYSELIRHIRDALRDYYRIKISEDLINNERVIQEVFRSVKEVVDLENGKALYDYFFNHLFGEKVDDFASSLVNIFSGRHLKHNFVQEIPLLTGEVAIKGSKALSLQEQGEIDFYLGMRLYLHGVDIQIRSNREVYFIRNVDNAYFKRKQYYPSGKANAFEYLLDLSSVQEFHAFVIGSARSYGWSLFQLAQLGILRAVIELPRAYNAKARNLYILDTYGENWADVLFINSDKLYSLLEGDDSLLASFISKLVSIGSDRHVVNLEERYYNNKADKYIERFFPYGYKDVPGLVYRASPNEIYANNSMNVARFVSSSVDEDLIFSPLDYAMIYHGIKGNDTPGGHYVIGNNGVGKSLLLRFLAEKLVNENQRLLLVSFGLTDRFHPLKGKRGIVYLGDKQSEKHISLTKRNKEILECTKNIFSDNTTHIFFNSILKKLGFSESMYCVPASYITSKNNLFDYSHVYKMEDFIAQEEKNDGYLLAIRHTNNDQIVIFDNLSSGEQQLLLMFSRIISNIAHGDVMLIDEPEVSMHIEWQQKLPYLFDMISEEYHASFVVATHSPIIINSVDMNKNKCYTASQAGLEVIDKNSVRNVESTIFDSFDVVTKNNRSVYETCAKAVSVFMETVNSNQDVNIQYQKSKKELRELSGKLNENNQHALTNEISLVRRAQDAIEELYHSYQQNEQVG